jgi:integrase
MVIDDDDLSETADLLSGWESDYREKLFRNDLESSAPEARDVLAAAGLELQEDSTEFRAICREILKIRIQAAEHGHRVASQGLATAPLDAVTTRPALGGSVLVATASPASASGPRFSEALTQYLRSKDDITEKSQRKYRATLDLWLQAMDDPYVSDATFTIEVIGKAREKLKQLPKNRGKGEKAGKSIDELIAMGKEPVSASTFRDWVVRLAEFTKWAASKRYLSFNPMEGEIPRKPKGRSARDERVCFTDDQLRTLFDPETFTKRNHANSHYKPSHYWVPLLSLMTGARLAELTGLSINDVKQDEEGNWLIHIWENELGRTVKTEAGERAIPVLGPLVHLGFAEYVEQIRAAGHRQLFPDIEAYRGDWSHAFSKWFGRHVTRIGLRDPGPNGQSVSACFHSLRHTVVNRLTNARLQPHEIKAVVGHEQSGETFKRYWKGFPPDLLANLLTALEYPIDWDGLKDRWRPAMAEIDRRRRSTRPSDVAPRPAPPR